MADIEIWIPAFAGMTQVERMAKETLSFIKNITRKNYIEFLTDNVLLQKKQLPPFRNLLQSRPLKSQYNLFLVIF